MHLKSALFWLLLSLPVAAQDEGGPVAHPEASRSAEQASPSSPSRPYSQSVQQAFFASGLKSAKPVLRVEYDAAGVPVKLALKPASGDQASVRMPGDTGLLAGSEWTGHGPGLENFSA